MQLKNIKLVFAKLTIYFATGERTANSETHIFENLCRQADKWVPPNSNLSCHYSAPHPYFKLGPLKEEVLLDDPPVLLFHDFVTQSEVDQIIELAKPKVGIEMTMSPYA